MTRAKKASYLLVPVILGLTVWLHLGPVILAGLFSYMVLDVTYRFFQRRLSRALSLWLALAAFLLAATALSWMLVRFVRQTIHTLPQIAATAIPRLVVLSDSHGINLPFDNVDELHEMVIHAIRGNAEAITKTSGALTTDIFHVLIIMLVAMLAFFSRQQPVEYGPNLFDTLRRELGARTQTFLQGFEKVFGAQLAISAAYAVLTFLFLWTMGYSHVIFLTLASFLFGVLPIIGNLISNIIIVASGLAMTTRHALFALGFLVLIHKSGYLVYGRVLGTSLKVPMWQTLLAILLGEAALGVPGMLLAPAMLHYIKEELRAIAD